MNNIESLTVQELLKVAEYKLSKYRIDFLFTTQSIEGQPWGTFCAVPKDAMSSDRLNELIGKPIPIGVIRFDTNSIEDLQVKLNYIYNLLS